MIRMIAFFCTVSLLFSCGNKEKQTAGILKPEKMQAVLWDIIRADVFTTQYIARDSSKNLTEENLKLQQQIFVIHHTTKEEFYRSYSYYKNNSKEMRTILDSMVNQADRKRPTGISPDKIP